MKLTIKSKQDYGTHSDEFNEEMECIKTELENSTLLTFQEGNIEIEDALSNTGSKKGREIRVPKVVD